MNKTPDTLSGIIERITYHSDESGYTVLRLNVPRQAELTTVVGNFASIQPGQTLEVWGSWVEHPEYGLQFKAASYKETKPSTLTGLEKYLGSGLIKGIGPVMASRIVKHFGLNTLDIIETESDRLIEVEGIGRKRVQQIQQAWAEQRAIKDVMIFLQSHGISTTYAVKIYKQYKDNAITIVTENPYQLAIDIYGIGFLTADRIAQQIGISPWSKYRYKAGLLHVLTVASEDGHCFLPFPELTNNTQNLLSGDTHQAELDGITSIVQEMVKDGDLVTEEAEGEMSLCYKPAFYFVEKNLAALVRDRMTRPLDVEIDRVNKWLERYTAAARTTLTEEQRKAIIIGTKSRVCVLTGGPGTGKTFTTRTIVTLWKAMGKRIKLAAPTGRAAKRLAEMARLEAKTIHRLLEFDPSTMGFKRDEEYPLDCDALIVDEVSMLDIFLAHSLLKALPPEAQILVVGDADQLPSVGPGRFFRDLIDSQQVPVIRLTRVFRQAAQSAIIRSAHAINQGNFPDLEPISQTPQSDCLWHDGGSEPGHGVAVIEQLLQSFLPSRGFDPHNDVQVLCPMIRGSVGTQNLNHRLQALLNPPHPDKPEVTRGNTVFRTGDRVIQQKNNYEYGVFNGDLGIIEAINSLEKELLIRFDDRVIEYDFADLNELAHSRAITIHKSQGSEYPVVILPLYTQHYLMLTRNLFYTALTRTQQLAIIIGSKKAIAIALNQVRDTRRYTRLADRIH